MRLVWKQVTVMTVLLVISIIVIVFGSGSLKGPGHHGTSITPETAISEDINARANRQLDESDWIAIGVILSKVLLAVILGSFALLCIHARVGKSLSKRNSAILMSTTQRVIEI